MKREYSDPSSGVGANYHWTGNHEVGEGTMTIKSIEERKVVIDLHFIEPFEGDSVATMSYAAEGEGTTFTWALDQDNDLSSKVFMVFTDMDKMLGGDYEKGLSLLKPLVETAALDRKNKTSVATAAVAEGAPAVTGAAGSTDNVRG